MFHLFSDQFCLQLRQKIWSWISYTAFKILTPCGLIILPPPGQAPKTAPVPLSHCRFGQSQTQASRGLHFTGKETECSVGWNPGLLPKHHFPAPAIFSSILKTFTTLVSLCKELYLNLEPEEHRRVGTAGKLFCREMWDLVGIS